MKCLCLLSLLAVLPLSSAKRGFILTGPKLFDVGKSETLILHLFDIRESGSVKIRLANSVGEVFSEVTAPIRDGQSTSVELPVPPTLPNSLLRVKLEVDGSIGDYRIRKSQQVQLRRQMPIVLVGTDKPLYKAGQTVKIRVLITDSDLKPHREAKVGQIWIIDPKKVRIAQWSNISLSAGLIHETLPLPEEPVLGQWKVEVKIDDRTYTKSFEVKEYVLPPFEVKITPPPYILSYAKNATWEVCAEYTYGKPVKGELFTKLTPSTYYWESDRKVLSIENTTEIKGCEKFALSVEELTEHKLFRPLEFYAEVTEDGTGTKMNSTSSSTLSYDPFTIKRIDDQHPRYFRPGIPLRMAMAVETPDSKPLAAELLNVCMEAVRKKWNEENAITEAVKVCKNYTSDRNGNIHFTIPPQYSNTVSLSVKVEAIIQEPEAADGRRVQKPSSSFTLSPWFSTGGSHIQLSRIPKIDCSAIGTDTRVSIPFHIAHSETGLKKMHYQIMSRGDIASHGDFDINLEAGSSKNVTDDTYLPDQPTAICADKDFQWEDDFKLAKYLSQNYLFFKFDEKMTPKVRILLYMVTDDGDVVADSVSYNTDLCFANQVGMRFGEEKQLPGAKATIHLTAEPQSLCSVGVVDKSVYILHQADLLTEAKINTPLLSLETSSYTYPRQRTRDDTYCSMKQAGYRSAAYLDSMSAFEDNGGLVLSDLPLETRPCPPLLSAVCPVNAIYSSYGPPENVFFAARRPPTRPPGQPLATSRVPPILPPPPPPPSPQQVTVRKDFPDTWLFKLYTTGDEGSLQMKEKMPDSITEWQGQAICIHPDKGLGFSKTASIVAFQPFFASMTLPYSVVRNEVVPIIVTVFNYLRECLPIKVDLHQTEHFVLYNGTLTKSVCVCGDDSTTIYFHVRPEKLGITNVTLTAETTEEQDICGNFNSSLDLKRSDTLTKPVLVEAEGLLKEETFNSYFCLTDEAGGAFNTKHSLKLPEAHLVEDSARAYTSATGDLMGPTLEGLERLVRMPTGCGEQNMIGLVPNIVVLDYLGATKKLTEKVRQKAVRHIKQGYVRQQKYKHPDGSYSAFGVSDKEGSMWLTAFVVRTFASARRYVSIDEENLESSRKWILSRQKDNGCFPMVGTVHHKAMKGGVSKEDKTTPTLTAYVLISMLESGKMDEEAMAKAVSCIEAKHKPSNYSRSLFAYATALAKRSSSSEYMEQLLSDAEKDGGFLYWNDSDRSIAVEIASYNILALLQSGRKEDFPKVASIARWLARQRNSYGGFYSTQDTAMGLQALGRYGSIITLQPPKMEISVKTEKVGEIFHVSPENELLMQRTNLKLEDDQETSVEILANGSGCALVQTSLRYNVWMPEPSEDFVLSVQTKRKSEDGCADVQIQICPGYNHPDGSNMAIIEIKMVTGYSPVISTVKELLELKELEVKRYEFKEDTNTLYLYISTLTQNATCFSFDVTQEIKVLDVKPSVAKVYDYYDEEKSISVQYSIEETCMG